MMVSMQASYDSLLSGISKQLDLQAKGNSQVASGKRFTRPAEASLDYKTSLDIRHGIKGVQSSLGAITTAKTRLDNSMSMINSMQQIIVRAESLATQQASAQITNADRQGALAEINALKDSLFTYANQKLDGQSLFAGTATGTAAFVKDAAGNVSYNGNSQDRTVAITTTQIVNSNVRGDSAAFSKMFAAFDAFSAALAANSQTDVQTALGQLNDAGASMTDLNAEVGARIRSLNLQQQLYDDINLSLQNRQSQHEGVDIAATVAKLQESSVALQAAYSQISTLRSLSLVNFLR